MREHKVGEHKVRRHKVRKHKQARAHARTRGPVHVSSLSPSIARWLLNGYTGQTSIEDRRAVS